MTDGRRTVRVTDEFFSQLDDNLGSERGSNGEPSVTDFLVFDLPNVVERFATGFDSFLARSAFSDCAKAVGGREGGRRRAPGHGGT